MLILWSIFNALAPADTVFPKPLVKVRLRKRSLPSLTTLWLTLTLLHYSILEVSTNSLYWVMYI